MHALALMPLLAFGTLDLSFNNLIVAFIFLVIFIILAVAIWRLVAPSLGQFQGIVWAIFLVIVILVTCHILGLI